jgi:hypothetical protein
MSTNEIELEPYKEVIDIMAARIKRAEQHNTYLSEDIFRVSEARGKTGTRERAAQCRA